MVIRRRCRPTTHPALLRAGAGPAQSYTCLRISHGCFSFESRGVCQWRRDRNDGVPGLHVQGLAVRPPREVSGSRRHPRPQQKGACPACLRALRPGRRRVMLACTDLFCRCGGHNPRVQYQGILPRNNNAYRRWHANNPATSVVVVSSLVAVACVSLCDFNRRYRRSVSFLLVRRWTL